MQSLSKLMRDTVGSTMVEYLVITGAVGLVLVAAAVALQSGYADGLIERSNATLGVD
jgi:Flp pilus assembly pilin Flp